MEQVRLLVTSIILGVLLLVPEASHGLNLDNVAAVWGKNSVEKTVVPEGVSLYPLWTASNTPATIPQSVDYARNHLAAVAEPDGRILALGDYKNVPEYQGAGLNPPSARRWQDMPSLTYPRAGLAAAMRFDGQIYAIGGETSFDKDRTVLKRVEIYNPANNRWVSAPDMPTPRSDLAATVGLDDRVYAVGGQNGSFLSAAESLMQTPSGYSWVALAPMPTARADLAAVTGIDGRIYALGGRNDSGFLSTVEVYDPVVASWTKITDMPNARAFLEATVATDGHVYAIGGISSKGTLGTIDVYDPLSDEWSTITGMPKDYRPLSPLAMLN